MACYRESQKGLLCDMLQGVTERVIDMLQESQKALLCDMLQGVTERDIVCLITGSHGKDYCVTHYRESQNGFLTCYRESQKGLPTCYRESQKGLPTCYRESQKALLCDMLQRVTESTTV